jgi:hypothetical protein
MYFFAREDADKSPPVVHSYVHVGSAQVRKTPSWTQKLGELKPFIAVFPQECMGQRIFWANLTPFSLQPRSAYMWSEARLGLSRFVALY